MSVEGADDLAAIGIDAGCIVTRVVVVTGCACFALVTLDMLSLRAYFCFADYSASNILVSASVIVVPAGQATH